MLKIKNLCQNLSIEEFQIVKQRLDIVFHVFPAYAFSLFFFFWEKRISQTLCHTSEFRALFTGPTNIFFQ